MRLRPYPLLLLLPLLSNSPYETHSINADLNLSENIPQRVNTQAPPSPKHISKYSTAGLLTIVSSTKNCSNFIGASQELVKRMKRDGQSEIFLGLHNHVYKLDGEKEFTLDNYVSRSAFPFVLQSTSPYLDPITKDFSLKEQEEIDPEIYFVFTPSLLNCVFGKPVQNILGMTYGSKLIFVKNSSDVHSSLFPSILAHELQHTKDLGKNLLEKEMRATQRERDMLYRQKKSTQETCIEDATNSSCSFLEEYDARLAYIEKRLKGAEYFSQKKFAGAFSQVYPSETILSSSLLEANISLEILFSYASHLSTGDPQKDTELMVAAEIAVLALQTPKSQRQETLQEIIDSSDREENERINAQAALAFFSPIPKEMEKQAQEYPDPFDGNIFYRLSEEASHTHPSVIDLFSSKE